MIWADFLRVVEAIILLAGVAGIFFVFFKNATTKTTISSQKDLIETLSGQIAELRNMHIQNEKAIAKLSGQVSVYKELPLAEMAKSMQAIAASQTEILKLIKPQ